MENLTQLTTTSRAFFILAPPRATQYSATQWHRLKVLACAAAGAIGDAACVELAAVTELDPELMQLADHSAEARRRGDANDVVRRGALLHTDIAMSDSLVSKRPSANSSRSEGLLVRAIDGEQADLELRAPHWLMARALLDAVRPEHDAMVRAWYQATGTWMQRQLIADTAHLAHGRTLFPDAADLWFLTGCQHERLASTAVQVLARTAVLPQGIALDIGPERTELKDAEASFRRALSVDQTFADAHLRLGHVLLTRGQFKQAADEFQLTLTMSTDRRVEYFASLFLGAAQEQLHQLEQAHRSYRRAADLYPKAQSPRFALSALAWRRGDREAALSESQLAGGSPTMASKSVDDPWWDYYTVPERDARKLFDTLWRPFFLNANK